MQRLVIKPIIKGVKKKRKTKKTKALVEIFVRKPKRKKAKNLAEAVGVKI